MAYISAMAKHTLNIRIDDDMRDDLKRWCERQAVPDITVGAAVRFAIKRFLAQETTVAQAEGAKR